MTYDQPMDLDLMVVTCQECQGNCDLAWDRRGRRFYAVCLPCTRATEIGQVVIAEEA